MKRIKIILSLIAGCLLVWSCVDEIQNLQNQIDQITDTQIKSIEQQLNSIKTSITDLENTDKSLKSYIDDLSKTSENLQKTISETDAKVKSVKEEFDKAIDDAKAEAAADNTALKDELVQSLETAKLDVLAQLEAARVELQNQVNQMQQAIEVLSAKDIELENKIAELKSYADNQNSDTKDWATATFVTLDQYNSTVNTVAAIQQTIEGLNESIAAIDEKIATAVDSEVESALEVIKNEMISEVASSITEDYTNAIANAKAETEAAYTKAIEDAIASLEASLKSWINSQLANYYNAAQTDAMIQALKNNLESQLSSQKSYLESLINSLEIKLVGEISANQPLIEELRRNLGIAQENIAKNANDIADNSTKISENSSAIAANSSSISANATAISNMEAQITSLENELNAKIFELQSRVTETENDIEHINNEISNVKADYAARIKALETDLTKLISENNELIKSNKALIEINASAIAANKSSIDLLKETTDEITETVTANSEAISRNASDIAENAALIAANASAINSNANAIASNAADIAQLRADLESMKAELTTAYKSAIKSAIETSEGKLTAQLASEVSKINSRIDNELATINNAITELTSRVSACEKDIKSIKEQINSLRNDIDGLYEQISAIIARIQSIAVIPDYSDGSVKTEYGVSCIRFEIFPYSAAQSLSENWRGVISLDAVYTEPVSKSSLFALPINDISFVDGFLDVKFETESLVSDYWSGDISANARLLISDGINNISSQYIHLRPLEPIDLTASGRTANCYIVSHSGHYSFPAKKGNSSETVEGICSVDVLWESFGTDEKPKVGELVHNVAIRNGIISFSSSERKGNAVIAAKDKNGEILWSWHIWLTDIPESQVYNNDAGVLMDRNLGATSAIPGDVRALGLLYQWGRKDPFLNGCRISYEDLYNQEIAYSTIQWPSTVVSDEKYGTISFSISHPTTFIGMNGKNHDWLYTGSENVSDISRWETIENEKGLYDPCPVGWRISSSGYDGVWAKAFGISSRWVTESNWDAEHFGMDFSKTDYLLGSSGPIWYPAAGMRHHMTGKLERVGFSGIYWGCSRMYVKSRAYKMDISNDASVWPTSYDILAICHSVRCQKE